jgi:16S rRNA (guanine(966)-N(2))-methyltransferase RsmD
MPDRVKEAVFDILGVSYGCGGALPPLRVADVFAGSGSLGLEALSRGAASCCFFERDLKALGALRRNLHSLGVDREASIVTQDAWRCAVLSMEGRPFELIFLDPPYRASEDTSHRGAVRQYLARLGERDDNKPFVVLHHHVKVRFETQASEVWRIVDQRTYGTNSVTFFQR